MAVLTQLDVIGQMRIDASHLRYSEFASVGDWDAWAGQMVSGRLPIVVRGFTINPAGIGGQASLLLLNTQDSALLSYGATDSGTIYYTNLTNSPDVLSPTNPNVSGGFTVGNLNYVGIDLLRGPDDTTAQQTGFLVPLLDEEVYKEIDIGITLKYKIVISLTAFGSTSNLVPIAKVTVDGTGTVSSVEDCRPMLFRLGSGSDGASATYSYGWPTAQSTRLVENPITSSSTSVNPFDAADKFIPSYKQWQDAVMSRIWEIGGGSNWYSPATGANDINFVIAAGGGFTISGTTVSWTGLSIGFTNSNAAYNIISDGSAALLSSGRVVFVTLNRSTNGSTISHGTTNWNFLYSSPGSGDHYPGIPYAIAWNINGTIYARGNPFPVGVTGLPATISILGVVELYSDPSTNNVTIATSSTANPIVPVIRNSSGYDGQVLANGISRPNSGHLLIGTLANDAFVQIGSSSYTSAIQIYGSGTVGIGTDVLSGNFFEVSNTDASSSYVDTFLTAQPATSTSNNAILAYSGHAGSELDLNIAGGVGTAQLKLSANNAAWPALGTSNTVSTISGSQINTGYHAGQNPLVLIGGGTTDNAFSVGAILNTEIAQSTTGGRIVSIRNNNTEKAYFDNNGFPYINNTAMYSSGLIYMTSTLVVTNTLSPWTTSSNQYGTGSVFGSTSGYLTVGGIGTYLIQVSGSFSASILSGTPPQSISYNIYDLSATTAIYSGIVDVSTTGNISHVAISGSGVFTAAASGHNFTVQMAISSGTLTVTSSSNGQICLSAIRIG